MPNSVFVVRYDDLTGFIVEKRYPQSLSLTEEVLNLVHFEHQKEKKGELIYLQIGELKIASLTEEERPNWVVCFVLEHQEEFDYRKEILT